jgi:hypothetical protein
MFSNRIKYIVFENASDLPVNISSYKINHLEKQNEPVSPREKKYIYSETGVWYVNTFVEGRHLWIERGLDHVYSMGEFHSYKDIIYGTYSYPIHPELYKFKYSELDKSEEGAIGMITFSLK